MAHVRVSIISFSFFSFVWFFVVAVFVFFKLLSLFIV